MAKNETLAVNENLRPYDDWVPDAKCSVMPSVIRVCLAFCPDLWEGYVPAIITGVQDDGRCNVTIFSDEDTGLHAKVLRLTRVTMSDRHHAGEDAVRSGSWVEWNEYQAGQAKKTEEAEGKLNDMVDELWKEQAALKQTVKGLADRLGEALAGNAAKAKK